MNGRFILSGGFIFRWRGCCPIGLTSALMWGAGRGGVGEDQKIHGVDGTPIMPLPSRAKPGLCCNRVKKKHELKYALKIYKKRILTLQQKALLQR